MAELKMGHHLPELYSFKYAPGARHKVDAQTVGEVCAELDASDKLTPENLVNVSRPDDAPVHKEFEWNDDVAAEKYRVTQAAALIRHVVLVEKPREQQPAPQQVVAVDKRSDSLDGTRAFGSLHVPGGQKERYVAVAKMLDDDEMRAILIGNAKRDFEAFDRKYRHLDELSGLIEEGKKIFGIE